MKTIWKFGVSVKDELTLIMPADAVILAVQVQNDTPYVWALVDPQAPQEARKFRVFGTGHTVPDNANETLLFVGTFQLYGGSLVFHLFEEVDTPQKVDRLLLKGRK